MRIINNYLHQDDYRKSLNDLSIAIFRHDLEPWYDEGFFNDKYIPYSYICEGKVVANVSISLMEFIIENKKKKAIQIGTVMTDRQFRKRGLIKQLMNEIITRYEHEVDFFYLFANDRVTRLYPKFGFTRVVEKHYTLYAQDVKKVPAPLRKLNPVNERDYTFLKQRMMERIPVSRQLGAVHDQWPLATSMLDQQTTFLNRYYLECEDVIVLAKREASSLNIYDIISHKPFSLDRILEKMVQPTDYMIDLHFMPELERYQPRKTVANWQDDTLFIRSKDQLPVDILFPLTSHI